MTTATTKARQRKARAAATALIPRGQHLIDQGADMLILSARALETPLPVFWADGELTARTDLPARDRDYGWEIDGNYQRALPDYGKLPGEDGPWQHYRALLLAAELERIPVAVITVTHDDPPLPVFLPAPVTTTGITGELPANLSDQLDTWLADSDGEFGEPDEEGISWRLIPKPPGPEEALFPVAPRTEDPPIGAPGPGSPDQDEATDD
jgi:hypothetical protein